MIATHQLTKRFRHTLAVDHLTVDIRPGRVTGFVGPNGAGKTTTIRMLLGLDTPSSGTALIGGRPYRTLPHPLRAVGTMLDASTVHGGRTARAHLTWVAASNQLDRRRIGQVLEQTGLYDVADRRVNSFSLGMRQRLGIAVALLGDPAVLVLDEPVNGLDPEGVRWVRTLLRSLADEGRTVLLSSHLITEMAQTADQLVVIGRGRLIADVAVPELTSGGRSLEEAYFALTAGIVQFASDTSESA